MTFKFDLVAKDEKTSQFRVGGRLLPDDTDGDIFSLVGEAYNKTIQERNTTLAKYIVVKKDAIIFANIDSISISNVLKLLKNSIGFELTTVVSDCVFHPESCKPLFEMEIHRLFD